jgi:dihydrofolate reductase
MGKVYLDMAMSLDGFISGPNGEDSGLHDWYFSPSGDTEIIKQELLGTIGAMILGKRAFSSSPEADGFDTPYKVPHFIVTHEARKTIDRSGMQFIFSTDGVEGTLQKAKAAAGDKDVCIAGGANTAQQFLEAGLLDELQIHLVPVLIGGGLRLFDVLPKSVKLEKTRTLESSGVTHLRYRIIKEKRQVL